MKVPQLRKKLEIKSCHNVDWEDNYSWVHQENILEVLKDKNKLRTIYSFFMECSICLETIHNTAFYTNCKCKSTIYHKDCIQKWLSLSRSCPFCKHIFPDMPKKGKYNQNSHNTDLNHQ